MTTQYKRSRILGLAFLIQFVTSFTAGVFVLPAATGVKAFGLSLGISQIMANVAQNAGLVRLEILIEFITVAGIIFLGAMLYSTVRKQHEGLALTAFGLYVLEGAMLAVAEIALFALLISSREFTAAGSPASMECTGRLLYEVMGYSSKIANFAFCMGGTIFYALLLKDRTVARPLSLWGLVSAQGVLAGVLLGLFGAAAPALLYLPYIPFELFIAIWILAKGINKESEYK